MAEALRDAGLKERAFNRGKQRVLSDWEKTMVGLLRHQVLLLAMKGGRAPFPVSSALWRGLQRQGFLTRVYDLGSIARRLLFLGDARMLLAELKIRSGSKSAAEENDSGEITNEDQERPRFSEVHK